MTGENFDKKTSIELTVGHLLVLWNIAANRLSELHIAEKFTAEEKRAIWVFEDLCEQELINQRIEGRPAQEWDALIKRALEYVQSLPVEFL